MTYKNTLITIAVLLVIAAAGLFFLPGMSKEQEIQNNPDAAAAQGKLDINAVCESALSYMTFADGASADAFVAECKEGKHPEVIDHYKAQMGLGEGAAI